MKPLNPNRQVIKELEGAHMSAAEELELLYERYVVHGTATPLHAYLMDWPGMRRVAGDRTRTLAWVVLQHLLR